MCPYCCMGEVSLHFILFFFCLQLLSPQFDALLSDGGNAKVLVSEGVYISNYSCISQVQEGVVNCGAVRGRGVEDGKVCVTRGGAIEVRMREGVSMKRGPISGGELRTLSLQCDTIPNGMIPDELCNLFLSVLIDEDKGVVVGVVSIIFMPSFSGVDDVFIITDRDV